MQGGSDELFAAVQAGDAARVREILAGRPELVSARDEEGATPLHFATEAGHREIVRILLDAGADVNARDGRWHATPAGWAIEYLRMRGGLLGIEVEDARYAIETGNSDLVRRYVTRHPPLREAVGRDGVPLQDLARDSGDAEIRKAFGID